MTKKKYFNATLAAALVASGVAVVAPATAEASFKDLKTTDYFYNDILNLQQRGIIQGFADGTFRPNAEVTRGQAAKILAGALGLDTVNVTNPGFKDIPKTHQYYGSIAALANAGIISGYEDQTFRQGEPILRNHMAKMIANGFKLVTLEGTTPFTDVRKDYAQYIAALYENKVTTGKTATTFDGASNVTRGQLATFVVRAENVQATEEATFTIDEVTGNTIKTSTGELKVTSATQAIFTESNAAALKGAQIIAIVKNNEIVEVKSLSIEAASSEEAPAVLDLGQATITGNVILKSASVKISNATIQGKLVIDPIKASPVASLGAIVANSTKGSTITLDQVTTPTIEVNRNETTVAGTATVDTLTVVKAGEVSINIEGTIKTLNVLGKDSNITLGANTKIDKLILPVDVNAVDVIKNYDSIKSNIAQIVTSDGVKVEAPTTSGSNSVYIPTSNDNRVEQISGSTISSAGTYGPSTGKQVINGDLFINTANVNLQNVTINGNLILGEGIGEGDVHLKGVNVTGQTIVKGGGKNSIYFTDSVLATVIVNKNTGAVRIVAQGSTQVYEVQLETPTLVVEQNLAEGSSGFEDITVSEAMQTAGEGFQVELTGVFETINSRATNVRINLSEQTDIRTLVLNAAAEVLGTGVIQQAHINAEGSTLSQRPQNLVLDINRGYNAVTVAGETITESYSDPNATATLTSALASQNAISLQLTNFIAGLTMSDFEVKAYIDGNEVVLQGLEYDANKQRITFTPLNVAENAGKTVEVKVTSKNAKVTGVNLASSYEVKTGFAGRITDIQYVGIPNLSIKFRAGSGTTQGEVVATATTDAYGYYSINLPAGVYTGEFSAPGYVTSYMIANSSTDVFLTDQHETAIRAAASQEIKIMLSWDKDPRDLDSHLEGPTVDGEKFHIYYGEKRTTSNGIVYADLDWDDVDSYGPETTTIRQLLDGEYRFYVHHFYGSNTLRTSGAKVQVFLGNATAPAHIFEVPEGEGTETYWNVFDLVVTNNGENVEVRPVNTLSEPREPQDEFPGEDTENPEDNTDNPENSEDSEGNTGNPGEETETPENTTNDTAGVITTTADTVNIAFTNTEITHLTTIDSIELITGTTADTVTITSEDSIAVTTSQQGIINVTFNKTRFANLIETDVTKVIIRFRDVNGVTKELEVSIN
ncbi:S-layer homology domain-containing protein [Solibacillus sp. A46]|uniref:S-layer homology domain-containing protein n=1 Tax=Solibacillus faecavium TaxID=2762221 RepID=A0ABR8XV07_9BACL|nr:S-layer homology domain-containing protein [Solibacillus faecavium]MBD8035772.1 S-layer homology domain-containing protein [Solibacillus faecavium]